MSNHYGCVSPQNCGIRQILYKSRMRAMCAAWAAVKLGLNNFRVANNNLGRKKKHEHIKMLCMAIA